MRDRLHGVALGDFETSESGRFTAKELGQATSEKRKVLDCKRLTVITCTLDVSVFCGRRIEAGREEEGRQIGMKM